MSTLALRDKLDQIPLSPGVYLFKDGAGTVIYIGKAKVLRNRVRSYFGDGDGRHFVPFLVREAHDIEVMLCGTEKEALLLENSLIKVHQPRYNIELKDDKNFLCLRIDPKQPYPRVEMTRRMRDDGARYFGPYHSATQIRQTVRLLNRFFTLRTCKDTVFKNRKRPCLQYEIKRCPGPCVFPVEKQEYQEHVADAVSFLEGRTTELLLRLKQRMTGAALEEAFEQAAVVRDQIAAIESSLEKQRVMSADLEDRDVWGIVREGESVVVQLVWVRHGLVRGGRTFDLTHRELELSEVLEDALRQYYDATSDLPRELLLPFSVEGIAALEEWLRDRRGGAVDVLVPERGPKVRLIELARNNAQHRLRSRTESTEAAQATLERLQRSLRLQNFPERVECYDISNTQGGEVVGSQVVFIDGVPAKAEYRMYRMKSVQGQDDFASMREMLMRRLKRGLEEGELPSLMVIDGGIGQLNVARTVFDELGIEGVDLCSLAKARNLADGRGYLGDDVAETSASWDALMSEEEPTANASSPSNEPHEQAVLSLDPKATADSADSSQRPDANQRTSPERIFLPGQKNPIVLKPYASELRLLTYLRDEAHRFAITYHRKLRKKRGLASQLETVSGLGPKRQRAIVKHFGSVKAFLEAEESALANIPSVPEELAKKARHALRLAQLAKTPG